jgi:hypothetical protein
MTFLLRFVMLLVTAPQIRPAHLMIFVTSDCPISNYYAPEIQDICTANQRKGLTCSLVYEDLDLDEPRMRAHLKEYGYHDITAVIDRDRARARRTGATVTPQAVLLGSDGRVRYRGRIDNRYEAFGKPRRVVTEHDLRDAIEAVLDGRSVRASETTALGCYIVSTDSRRKQP